MFLKNYWSIYKPTVLIDCNNILLTLLIWSYCHAEKSYGKSNWKNESSYKQKGFIDMYQYCPITIIWLWKFFLP